MAARLQETYKKDVFPALMEKFKYNNVWFNIKDIVDVYKIKTIPVYVTKGYKKYYIDFTTLETLNN